MYNYVFIISIALNLIAIVAVAILWLRQKDLHDHITIVGEEAAEGNLPLLINQSYAELKKQAQEIELLNQYYSKLYRLSSNTMQNVSMVRFDAFDNIGGNLSFSLALLNNQKDGIVFTNINGRTEHRLYAKQIVAGSSIDHPLTKEEQKAIQEALKSSNRKLFEAKPKREEQTSKAPK